jgi:hypothetical protein
MERSDVERSHVYLINEESMYAIRQMQTIKDGKIVVSVPVDFAPTNRVEVIILPAPVVNEELALTAADRQSTFQNFTNLDTSTLTSQQKIAYQSACAILDKGRQQSEPRILGLFAGLVTISADFDAPLPEDVFDLFNGSQTDEYGMSLPQ